jgi:uncharacterized protein with FMN-binding domain
MNDDAAGTSRVATVVTKTVDNLKKIVLSLAVVVLFALYARQEKTRSPRGTTAVIAENVTTVTPRAPRTKPANVVYLDGTYTGDPGDAIWGKVVVEAVITGGRISAVQILEYPDHRSLSQSINAEALPVLIHEAIASQRAQVDVVTGATDTSDAFVESLDSALFEAEA